MIHLLDGDCANCRKAASGSIGSFHAVKQADSRNFGNLFLPDKATRHLLQTPEIDWDRELVELFTRRRGPGAGQVDVEAEAVKRLSPADPALRTEAELHLVRQVIRYFTGRLSHSDAEQMILSWTAGDALVA